ncbi:MAG: fibronectin type III domain-containing protein [Bacteroidota bacterium]|nr:fibronectin type III domain-containing protein [Bacteroidota bacterium]
MKRIFTLLITFIILISSASAQDQIIDQSPKVVTGILVKITKPLINLVTSILNPVLQFVKVRDDNGIIGIAEELEEGLDLPKFPVVKLLVDPVLQKVYPNFKKSSSPQTSLLSFDGITYSSVAPADASIAVGPNHIIQMINGPSGAMFEIFNKSGTQLIAPTYLDNITGKGGLGDPIVLYDQLADRFVMTEFVNKNETIDQGLSIAISQTNDPTGSWYIYFFSTGTTIPDYPKFSIWNNGYYAKTNDFNSTNAYINSSVYAFDRTKMLAGNSTVTMQIFNAGASYKAFSISPVSLQGTALPSSGTGGLFAYLQDDSWTGSSTDSIGLLEFVADFATSSNSKLIAKVPIATASYKPDICSASRSQCIPQPGTSVMLEAQDQRVMNQPMYRNFGTYEGIVFTNTVDKGNGTAGLRWYELKRTTGNWNINQQSTYSPDSVYRFMPAISYDIRGNIGLAYNVSGTNLYPGIRYTGRKQCDGINMMTYAENSLADGTAANKNSRYGDYNQLVCDPDGKTFWFTGMYNTSGNWSTKISSFTLDTCVVSCGDPGGLMASNITSTTATVNWNGVGGAVSYDVDYKLNTSTAWTSLAVGITYLSVNLSGLNANTIYDWRVRSKCSSGYGNYITSQFTTVACAAPTALKSSNITANSANVSWTSVAGASSYSVDYKNSTSTNWISAASSTGSTSVNLTGLSASTTYNWRVKTNCSNSASSYTSSQFTTPVTCVDILEPNNSLTAAATIQTGTNINAQIATATDVDYYSFSNNATNNNIKVTLTNLPANYDLTLYDPSGKSIATSKNAGTTVESIMYYTNVIGTYKVLIAGVNRAYSNTQCYTLNVQVIPDPVAPGGFDIYSPNSSHSDVFKVFPIPASKNISIIYQAYNSKPLLIVKDGLGKTIITKSIPGNAGQNIYNLDVSHLINGIYFIKLFNWKEIKTQKLIVAK